VAVALAAATAAGAWAEAASVEAVSAVARLEAAVEK
tara:strand:- start:628 stop:735 length:108 start_codon:yes stop_codon:yes gene_type:complete